VDEADQRELLAVFLLDAPGRMERMGRALDSGRLAAAADEAHSLYGAAATVALEGVAAGAERLERELRAGADVEAARRRLETIAALVGELAAEPPPAVRAAAGGAERTVLHVEDNPVNATLIERALARRPGVRLLTAARADTGLHVARATRPDLILLDLNLPDASGGDLLRRLREEPVTRDVPVVVVSGHEPEGNGDVLRELGVREHLTKPIDVGRLLELVDELAPTGSR
jgi:CheY-like chemotaxis protein